MAIVSKIFYYMWGVVGISILILVVPSVIKWCNNVKRNLKNKWKKNKLTKNTSKKQIRKHDKKKSTINYNALKFEYSNIWEIVSEAAIKAGLSGTIESGVYILKFSEHFKKKKSYDEKFGDLNSLDTLSCLVKALIEWPVATGNDSGTINLNITLNVIEQFKNNEVTYNKAKICNLNKEDLIIEMRENYRLYGDDIFLVALYVIDKLYD